MNTVVSLWGLFASSFVSATLFPGGSEVVLVLLARGQEYDPWLLLLIASLGNTLGSLTTWLLGYLVAKRFPLEQRLSSRQRQAVVKLQKWGSLALLGAWLPIVGDPLCFAAGYLRLSFPLSLLFIALGKTARYAVLILVFA